MLNLFFKARWGISALLLGFVTGCAPLKLPKTISLPGQGEKPQVPLKMTALWTDTVLVEAGIAGFGGRVMFYCKDEDTPVMVDGELTVYAYDDSDPGEVNSVPARKFVFRTEELSKHYSKSSLGHSYSFWLPWGSVGGPARQISLVARFRSKAGGVIMSEMTRHYLPGTDDSAVVRPPVISTSERPGPRFTSDVRQATHDESIEPPAATPPPGMTTTTITLPPRLGRAAAIDATAGQNHGLDVSTSVSGGAVPKNGVAAQRAVRTPAEDEPGSADSRALIREIRALRESLQSRSEASPSDRFARRTPRARIAPMLPPNRGPAPKQPLLAGPQSALPQTPRTGQSNESPVISASAAPGTNVVLPAGSP